MYGEIEDFQSNFPHLWELESQRDLLLRNIDTAIESEDFLKAEEMQAELSELEGVLETERDAMVALGLVENMDEVLLLKSRCNIDIKLSRLETELNLSVREKDYQRCREVQQDIEMLKMLTKLRPTSTEMESQLELLNKKLTKCHSEKDWEGAEKVANQIDRLESTLSLERAAVRIPHEEGSENSRASSNIDEIVGAIAIGGPDDPGERRRGRELQGSDSVVSFDSHDSRRPAQKQTRQVVNNQGLPVATAVGGRSKQVENPQPHASAPSRIYSEREQLEQNKLQFWSNVSNRLKLGVNESAPMGPQKRPSSQYTSPTSGLVIPEDLEVNMNDAESVSSAVTLDVRLNKEEEGKEKSFDEIDEKQLAAESPLQRQGSFLSKHEQFSAKDLDYGEMTTHPDGRVMTHPEKIDLREKYGYCTTCIGVPIQLYTISKNRLRRVTKTPISIDDQCHAGKCLICHPLENPNHSAAERLPRKKPPPNLTSNWEDDFPAYVPDTDDDSGDKKPAAKTSTAANRTEGEDTDSVAAIAGHDIQFNPPGEEEDQSRLQVTGAMSGQAGIESYLASDDQEMDAQVQQSLATAPETAPIYPVAVEQVPDDNEDAKPKPRRSKWRFSLSRNLSRRKN
jgi:hypothetical protein